MNINASNFGNANGLVIRPQPKDAASNAIQREEPERGKRSQNIVESQILLKTGSQEAYQKAERFHDKQSGTYREFNDGRSRDAIFAYQSHAIESKREEIQGLMGVDTYV